MLASGLRIISLLLAHEKVLVILTLSTIKYFINCTALSTVDLDDRRQNLQGWLQLISDSSQRQRYSP